MLCKRCRYGLAQFRDDGGHLTVEVEAWSRAGDRLADLLYSRLRLAKEIQLNMWVHFCLRAAGIAGGHPRGGVTIDTRSLSTDGGPDTPPLDEDSGLLLRQ